MSTHFACPSRWRQGANACLILTFCVSMIACTGQVSMRAKGGKAAAPKTKPGQKQSQAATGKSATQNKNANLLDLSASVGRIKGKLGQPIGTIMVIEGFAIDNRQRALELGGDDLLLRIEAVNFKKLQKPIIMPPFLGVLSNTFTPEYGTPFALVGYETGAYTGVPVQARKWAQGIPPRMATGIEFKSYFQILTESDGLPLDWGA